MWEQELQFARTLAAEAGALIREGFGLGTAAVWKEDNSPVTAVDLAVNARVIERVRERFPSHGVLGEEERYEADRPMLWVVDPIDGTNPFVLGAPLSTFCLALVVDGEPVVGVVHDPYLDRMFWAATGSGAHVNETPIWVSPAPLLARQSVVLSSRALDGQVSRGELFDAADRAGAMAFNFRSFAYGAMFVAAGTAVGAMVGVPHAWDVAAVKLVVEEAGGKATDLTGGSRRYDGPGKGLLVSNGLVHDELLALLER